MNNNFPFLDLTVEASAKESEVGSVHTNACFPENDHSLVPFFGPCLVLDLHSLLSPEQITVTADAFQHELEMRLTQAQEQSSVDKSVPSNVKRVLLKTRNGNGTIAVEWEPYLKVLKERGIILVGSDGGLDESLTNAGIAALGNLELSSISGAQIGILAGGPAKIEGQRIVACRAVFIITDG